MGKQAGYLTGLIAVLMLAYTTAQNGTSQGGPLPFCLDGNITRVVGETWQPDAISSCTCTPALFIACFLIQPDPPLILRQCRDHNFNVRQPGDKWLNNPTANCTCESDHSVTCNLLKEPACTDVSGVIRASMEVWINSSCVQCTCVNGSISCTGYDVKITYGLFEVNTLPTCEQCVSPEQTTEASSACEAYLRFSERNELSKCTNGGHFIWDKHRCNGISECPDGSDEQGCEDEICKDEEGGLLLFKDGDDWRVSPCLLCQCSSGVLSCQRNLTVNFPGYFLGASWVKKSCSRPSCDVLQFIRNEKDSCEGVEVIKDGGVLLKGQTWRSRGCDFFFNRSNAEIPHVVCPPMARSACYVYNGAVCCSSECSDLEQFANQMRGNVTYCSNKRQLISSELWYACSNPSIKCARDYRLQNCTSEVTCQDEDSNTYFEGATWSVGDYIQCSCKRGKIHCSRKISVLTWSEETLTDHCNQTQCDVARFVEKNKGICKACRWNGKLYFDGDRWKENGVDFYCSSSDQKARPGCYVEYNRMRCTGAIKGIRNLALISNKKLFLCESGDEIRSLDDRCNRQPDCDDQSDERNCDQYYCAAFQMFGILWTRALVQEEVFKECSLINSSWTGTVSSTCRDNGIPGLRTHWSLKTTCDCEKRILVEYFNKKIADVNSTNFMNVSWELSNSSQSFINSKVFFDLFEELFYNVTRLLTPITLQNADLALQYSEHVIGTLMSDNRFFRNALRTFCTRKLAKRRDALIVKVMEFLRQAPQNTTAYKIGSTLQFQPTQDILTGLPHRGNFNRGPLSTALTRQQLVLQINTAPLVPIKTTKALPAVNNTNNGTGNNGTGENNGLMNKTGNARNDITDQQIKDILRANNCSWAFYDEEQGVVIFKDPSVTSDSWKQNEIQDELELVLLCLSITAVIVSLFVLSMLRIRESERIFIHKNLLLSLGLGNLVYVLDKGLFTTRKEYPAFCSTVAVVQYFLHTALFTWMLVEGINLYIKLVKVFTVSRQYLVYGAIGWGIPAVIVGLVAAIKPSTYDMGKTFYKDVMCGSLKLTAEIQRTRCWLNGSLWIYKGPVLAILLANLVLFVILLRVVFGKLSTRYGNNQVAVARRGFRSIVALLPLLGVTWLLGFVIEFHDVLVYAFILLNSTQGIVFCIFHCVLDDQVRESVKRFKAKRQSETGPATNHPTSPVMERNSCAQIIEHSEEDIGEENMSTKRSDETKF